MDLNLIPDLNFDVQINEDEQTLMSSNIVIEFGSLTIEEMEARLSVNQPMENEEIGYGLYSIYARAKGFSVRRDKIERFTDGSGIRAKDFVCHCEGIKDEKRSLTNTTAFVKPTVRCNCKAKLRVARLKGQNWRVTVFKKDHTHDLYPSDQTYLLRTSRHMSSDMENYVEGMVKCGIPVARIYEFLQQSCNGRENIGFTQKDMYNSISRKRSQSKIEDGDAAQLVQHFMEKTNNEPYFYWNVERDDDKRIKNIFFRDYRCSIDYQYFGDVVSFDTTYRTNKYNLSCCPFVGINHHMQNVMFGFALLSDETEVSFEWLFRTFLESMGYKQPITIFTDQCQAMMNAIKTVFEHSHHRLCHWHINQNAPSHFGSLNGNSDFKKLWHKCMTGCDEVEEFERTWMRMVEEYNVGNINWFNQMYELREKWSTVFSCEKFSAGLKATSRSEGTNNALKKKFGGATSSLYDCVLGYEKVQESWRMDEKEKDTISHHGRLPDGDNVWLKQASEVYTMQILTLFQKEVSNSMNFAIMEVHGFDTSMSFKMKKRSESSRIITVKFDNNTLSINCSCHKFETTGILCSHALKVFDRVNINFIPEKYIMKRWTKSVTARVCSVRHVSSNSASEMAFVHGTMREIYELAMRAQIHKEMRLMLTELIGCAKTKLNSWLETHKSDELPDVTNSVMARDDQTFETLVRNPFLVKAKGVTNVCARHWEAKKKKRKMKV